MRKSRYSEEQIIGVPRAHSSALLDYRTPAEKHQDLIGHSDGSIAAGFP